MARLDLAKARAQDHRCPDQGHRNRRDPAHRQPFAQKQGRANTDIDWCEVVHGGDFRDGNTGHGVKPQDHPARMEHAPQGKEPPLPRRQMRGPDGGQHGQQEHQAEQIAQKRGLRRGYAWPHIFDEGGHSHKTQARDQHPENAQQWFGRRGRHVRIKAHVGARCKPDQPCGSHLGASGPCASAQPALSYTFFAQQPCTNAGRNLVEPCLAL
mmetsp:Transcript_28384/g.53030  ORF Transcript_28384/g.53030 Transcript_28384/m.53030 type:complete len:211 (+) Transcript_28384:1068-1700(+)